jgi:hypothetical protein
MWFGGVIQDMRFLDTGHADDTNAADLPLDGNAVAVNIGLVSLLNTHYSLPMVSGEW